jgi:hypothetical protein
LMIFKYIDDHITSINCVQGSISLWIVWIIAKSQCIEKVTKIVSAKMKMWINSRCENTWHLALAFLND